jgi:hypothetical protein
MNIKRVWGMVATMHIVWGMLAFAVWNNWPDFGFASIVLIAYLGYWLGVITTLGSVDAAIECGEI